MNDMSVCGTDCKTCEYYQTICKGCNVSKGVVFHTDSKECDIYKCCVIENKYSNCFNCSKIPCNIWLNTQDPNLSDEEFKEGIEERVNNLRIIKENI